MKKLLLYIGIVSILGTSCKKDFLTSLSNNPNSPTSSAATPPLVLPGAISSLASIVNSAGGYQVQAAWMGYWNYSGGYSFNQTVQEYVMTNSSPQLWDNYYGILTNLNVIKQQANSNAAYSQYGAIADVLSAICFQNLVDLYENVPYSQALKGSNNFFPGYDKGSDIYDSLTAKLDLAIAKLSNPVAAEIIPGSDDVLFSGNLANWAYFANTVKLRLLLRQSAVSAKQAFIKSEISKTASVGYISQDATVNPGYSTAQQGPMYGAFGVSTGGGLNGNFNFIRAGAFALNFYLANNDPRVSYFYCSKGQDPTNGNSAVYGNYYLDTVSINTTNYYADYLGIQVTQPTKGSGIGKGLIRAANQSTVLMLYSECNFLQAEAILRGYTSGNAETLYQQGITASFEYLGVGANPDAAAQTYYSQTSVPNVSWPASVPDQIQAVIIQKWASLNGINNVEAWNDWRRTGFPVVPLSKSPTLPSASHIPFRYFYPTGEPTTNTVAWTAAGGDKIDVYNTKVFWMP